MKRFTRLSLGFSKELTNLRAAVALHVFHTIPPDSRHLKRTLAMATCVTDRRCSLNDLFD